MIQCLKVETLIKFADPIAAADATAPLSPPHVMSYSNSVAPWLAGSRFVDPTLALIARDSCNPLPINLHRKVPFFGGRKIFSPRTHRAAHCCSCSSDKGRPTPTGERRRERPFGSEAMGRAETARESSGGRRAPLRYIALAATAVRSSLLPTTVGQQRVDGRGRDGGDWRNVRKECTVHKVECSMWDGGNIIC